MASGLSIGEGDALLVVDLQKDFLPGGRLPVPEGDAVVPAMNRCLRAFRAAGRPVFATRDWHPPEHVSFQAQGGPWPPHCVAGDPGADFADGLELPADVIVVSKATRPDTEAYSGFQGTDLDDYLRALEVRRLFVGGLATDYCVLETVKDARKLGYEVVLLQDAMRAVDAEPGAGERALEEMRGLGAAVAASTDLGGTEAAG
ncbi:nicotinamidase [Dissulfurirhabdus thermomarina]|uniref:nicotinamidase n=1 Tax=Dissulfurirhabdus thermomarina TaxID=1765737 RepID=A0A6N9TQQ2_DISTH|nr:nicotinamidase [Dissulfurirhabdus thermomarina]NDY42780.1 nicotinamidase [Dissulfurirhabdus thermomarina]NMX22624.1 nicotinamidase [Dissulfurirhabdus thermomarina]